MGISKIEVITGMSKLTNLICELSKVGVRGVTVMQVLGCGVELGTKEYRRKSLKNIYKNLRTSKILI